MHTGETETVHVQLDAPKCVSMRDGLAKAVFDAWGRTSGPGSSLIAEDLQADEQLHPLDSLGRPLPMPPWGESEYGYGTEFGYGTYDP